jgi:hypothetical protein
MQLKVTEDEFLVVILAESVKGIQHKLKEGVVLLVFGGELVDKLGDIQSAGGQPEVVLNGEEGIDGLGADNCV